MRSDNGWERCLDADVATEMYCEDAAGERRIQMRRRDVLREQWRLKRNQSRHVRPAATQAS